MSSRVACWLNGHIWLPAGRQIYNDIFGNEWRLQWCDQCSAKRRVLHRAWSETS